MKLIIEDRDVLSLDVEKIPCRKIHTTGWMNEVLVWISGLFSSIRTTFSGKFIGIYKFWLEDNSCVRPGNTFTTENGMHWYVTLVGTSNTIIAKTISSHPTRAFQEMEEKGIAFINGISQPENNNERLEG